MPPPLVGCVCAVVVLRAVRTPGKGGARRWCGGTVVPAIPDAAVDEVKIIVMVRHQQRLTADGGEGADKDGEPMLWNMSTLQVAARWSKQAILFSKVTSYVTLETLVLPDTAFTHSGPQGLRRMHRLRRLLLVREQTGRSCPARGCDTTQWPRAKYWRAVEEPFGLFLFTPPHTLREHRIYPLKN